MKRSKESLLIKELRVVVFLLSIVIMNTSVFPRTTGDTDLPSSNLKKGQKIPELKGTDQFGKAARFRLAQETDWVGAAVLPLCRLVTVLQTAKKTKVGVPMTLLLSGRSGFGLIDRAGLPAHFTRTETVCAPIGEGARSLPGVKPWMQSHRSLRLIRRAEE